jgi:hypothetical protein
MSNQVNTDLIEEALELAEIYVSALVQSFLIEIMKEELDNIALKERI